MAREEHEEQEARSPPSQAQKALPYPRPPPSCWPGQQPPTISKGLINSLAALSPPHDAQQHRLGEAASRPAAAPRVRCSSAGSRCSRLPSGPPELAPSGSQTAAIPARPCEAHLLTVRSQCPSGKCREAACTQTLCVCTQDSVHPGPQGHHPCLQRHSHPHVSTGPCAHPDMHIRAHIIENMFSPGIIPPSRLEEAGGVLSTEK